VWKQTWLTKKYILEFWPHQYWGAWKKNQILAKTSHLLASTWILFFKLPQILGPILVFVSSLKKHDYNNLTFEIYANKSLKIMYPKNIYYPHKIIYLIVLFFKDPNILWLTLLFMYILPCFHPIGVSFVVVVIWHHCDFFKGTFASHCLCFFHGHVCVMTSLLLLLVL